MTVRLIGVLALAAALAAAAPAAPGSGQPGPARFQTPSRNIGCLSSTAPGRAPYLRCDVLSGLSPEPKRPCPVDWTGYSMTANSRATPTCAGDTVYARSASVVAYGRTWRRGGFTCTVRRAGLRCRNTAGHGFFLSRTRSYAF